METVELLVPQTAVEASIDVNFKTLGRERDRKVRNIN